MTLTSAEFIRRFIQHILPKRFTKIRSYGYLAYRNRHQRINDVLKKMKLPVHKELVKIPVQLYLVLRYGINIAACPDCKNRTMQLISCSYPWAKQKTVPDG